MKAFNDERAGDLAQDISAALMLVLEQLSPLKRASFLCTMCLAPCSRAGASDGSRKRFKIADYERDAIN